MISTHIYTREIYRRIGQTEDIWAATTRGLNLSEVDDDMVVDELLHELGHRRHTYVQLTRQLRKGAIAVESHIGYDIALDDVVLVRDTLQGLRRIDIEKLSE